jgi:hypothetical protein
LRTGLPSPEKHFQACGLKINPGHNKNLEIIFLLSSIPPEDKAPGSWQKEKANILRLG